MPGGAAHPLAVCLISKVFDRRAAIDPRQQDRGEQRNRAVLDPVPQRGRDRVQIGGMQAIERGGGLWFPLRVPHALQQHMRGAEREVEGRIAIPGAFGVDQHRPGAATQDVLGADIAVDQCGACGLRRGGDSLDDAGQIRVCAGGVEQVGLDPQRREQIIGGEPSGNGGIALRRGMDRGDGPAHRCGKGRIDPPGGQLGLPHRVLRRGKPFHEEQVLIFQLCHHARHVQPGRAGDGEPFDLVVRALRGSLPYSGDPQARQRTLGAERGRGSIHPEHIARYPARQRGDDRNVPGGDQPCAEQAACYDALIIVHAPIHLES